MSLYELLFILLFIGSVISLVLTSFLWRRGGSGILIALASVWAVYLVILAATAFFSSQKVFKVGQEQCFDEMCFAVTDLQIIPAQPVKQSGAAASMLYAVSVRIANHSRGHAQAEGGLRGRLYQNGTYIEVSQSAQKAYDAQNGGNSKLTQQIAPGESALSVLVFEVPQGMTHPAFTLDHGFTPGYFVIGESPFFHQPDIHQLQNVGDQK